MTDDNFNIEHLQQWVGTKETTADELNVAHAVALAACLDLPVAPLPGDALPPLWHWMYFWQAAPQSRIGSDGHPERGGFLPPVPLPRRMWAGGRLRFDAPLPVGAGAQRTSTILDLKVKDGRSGRLAFVTVGHEIRYGAEVAIREEQDIVYRDPPQPGSPAPSGPPAPREAAWERQVVPDPVLLFRYSALTLNGHRIHYDRAYATDVEGYPGLVVHGPLIATLLADLLRRRIPDARLAEFSFRALSPLFDTEPFTLRGQPDADGKTLHLWAENIRGELAMQATAILAAPFPTR
ncbi:acyl-CoA dehydrogenase [Herbaspirillum rubrisubalbicans]|jgi:3-methylfumaryl-CoA hydratase|uniref:Acyl-CoA dehydrogenase n=2 Tax=Herbaspirillum rubrisubalbicans TaxID=80842 RepID=A0ABX9C741_9BURK|nr:MULTISPECIES: MaoC family dehydratase N-terminal domain-containing protein [Herbaspirillum]MCP1572959.1 3-methylfumaryl-CoA hydratase [Herbaspirillum rubrisubalbicans]QJQ01521.1 acyl-CoA dehydrogenase [Herbaspirillum rubrisubalbicans Os34]RAM66758.1 acyl-CoA dehydrogenase [Herbaspirillum rubrisubalbicans]RAN47417.1 acyl-CoA dehydrogenase [Herbaspirillum rubrisubalbicans]